MARRAITRRKPHDPRACAVSRCSGFAGLAFLAIHCPEIAAAADTASAPNNLQFAEVRPAHAEDEPKMAASGTELQEITITAQKREQRLQDVPISAQVISGRTLTQRNFTSLDALTETVPGVFVLDQGPASELFIRGIGSGRNAGFDQSVATFEDDIYHGRSRMSLATFLDLDRIELLKGPQSTFFGNNAIAGALNLITRKPGDTFDASVRALYGMFGTYGFEAAAGGPVTNVLGLRFALTENGTAGWIHNVYTDADAPKAHDQAMRLTVAFHPIEDLDSLLKIQGSEHTLTGAPIDNPFVVTDCPPPAPYYVPRGFCAAALAQHVPTYPYGNVGTQSAAAPGQGNWFSTFENLLTVNYQNWSHTFTSVTGFYNYHFSENFNIDQTPANLLAEYVGEKYHQFSQEFRVASATDRPIQYLGGIYFQTDQLDPNPDSTSLGTSYFFLTPRLSGIPPLAPHLPLGQSQAFFQGEHVYSVFGSLDWIVTDTLKLSAGIRGSEVKKNATVIDYYATATQPYGGLVPLPASIVPIPSAILGPLPPVYAGQRTDHAWMPSGSIQLQIDSHAMMYFSYTHGFKAGGFNGSDLTSIAASVPFQPEYVNAFELGEKSEWLARRLLVNIDLFRSNYSDLQSLVAFLNPSGVYESVVRNAASARTQGIELEAQWLASDRLRLSTNASYINAYYLDYKNGPPTLAQQFENIQARDLAGQSIGISPPFSASLTATFTQPLPRSLNFIAEVSPYFSSRYDMMDDPLQHQPSFIRLDGRLGIESQDNHWTLELIGKNLTDRQIMQVVAGTALAKGTRYVTVEERRNVALQVQYRF
jgi:iron complex outermembrane receptor protein